jgi:hypothetical protein
VGVFLFDTKQFFKYEKTITTRIHARGDDDAGNEMSDELTKKWEIE